MHAFMFNANVNTTNTYIMKSPLFIFSIFTLIFCINSCCFIVSSFTPANTLYYSTTSRGTTNFNSSANTNTNKSWMPVSMLIHHHDNGSITLRRHRLYRRRHHLSLDLAANIQNESEEEVQVDEIKTSDGDETLFNQAKRMDLSNNQGKNYYNNNNYYQDNNHPKIISKNTSTSKSNPNIDILPDLQQQQQQQQHQQHQQQQQQQQENEREKTMNFSEDGLGAYDPAKKLPLKRENYIVGDPQLKVKKEEKSVAEILTELAAIQKQGPQKYCILGSRHVSYLHQQIIELLSYALVLSENHVYTSGAGGTNAAAIRGALRAGRPDLLTVILPQSLHKQTDESQELLRGVTDLIAMPQNDDMSLDVASRLCNSKLLSETDQLVAFAFHESTTVIEATKEAKKLEMLVTTLYLD